jgi:macrodomain Ter protein organizer (MatP/YcbG family)
MNFYKLNHMAGGGQWLTLVILATQEAEIRRRVVQSQAGQIVQRLFLSREYPLQKGLSEWLKVKVLSSSLSTKGKKTQKNKTKKPKNKDASYVA